MLCLPSQLRIQSTLAPWHVTAASLVSSATVAFAAVWSAVDNALDGLRSVLRSPTETPSLIDMASDPAFSVNAHLDATISVPELVMSCLRYLGQVDYVAGVLLVRPDAGTVSRIERQFYSDHSVFPDPQSDDDDAHGGGVIHTAYAVGGVLEAFLLSLPDPPVPHSAFMEWISCASLPHSTEEGASASSPAKDSVTDDHTVPAALKTAHQFAVERFACISARCKQYRVLFDALPHAHRCVAVQACLPVRLDPMTVDVLPCEQVTPDRVVAFPGSAVWSMGRC